MSYNFPTHKFPTLNYVNYSLIRNHFQNKTKQKGRAHTVTYVTDDHVNTTDTKHGTKYESSTVKMSGNKNMVFRFTLMSRFPFMIER